MYNFAVSLFFIVLFRVGDAGKSVSDPFLNVDANVNDADVLSEQALGLSS